MPSIDATERPLRFQRSLCETPDVDDDPYVTRLSTFVTPSGWAALNILVRNGTLLGDLF